MEAGRGLSGLAGGTGQRVLPGGPTGEGFGHRRHFLIIEHQKSGSGSAQDKRVYDGL